jgi:general secretion pathway protein G
MLKPAPPFSISIRRKPNKYGGFTLIEVMIVIVILGVLAAVIVPNVIGRAHDARVAAAKQDVATISQALAMYRLDNARVPSAEQGLKALVEKPALAPLPNNWRTGGYIQRLPNDPWGNPYQYANPGLRGEIDVFSFGADGKAGGDGEGADLGTWNL